MTTKTSRRAVAAALFSAACAAPLLLVLILLRSPLPIVSVVPSDYYYCGSTWTDANSLCATHCPNGIDSDCPPGQFCFADCMDCPAASGPPPAAGPPSSGSSPAPPVGPPGDDSRTVAFVGNWQSCPTDAQLDQYTHIVVSFAVTYVWSEDGNVCDEECTIVSPVPICRTKAGQNQQSIVDSWKARGKRVLVSFGGAGMGGSWDGDVNYCWEYCFGREEHVVSQLVSIVQEQNFDGVDLDYEYFYEDNGAYRLHSSNGAAARSFIEWVTVGLRAALPKEDRYLLTHAPMDSDMVPGSSYYDILVRNAEALDFLMPQYYNGIARPVTNGLLGGNPSALSHYNNLVTAMFGGDPTKVVFGFCITDCSDDNYNADAPSARAIMSDLREYHPCNGGMFFWVSHHDGPDAAWSSVVNGAVRPGAGCSGEPTAAPTPSPSLYPPAAVVPTRHKPTDAPGSSSSSSCGASGATCGRNGSSVECCGGT